MSTTNSLPKHSIDINSPMAVYDFNNKFTECLNNYFTDEYEDLVVMCIGTDRSTGDALGPLIGYKLKKSLRNHKNIFVHGTLENPVHAKNLSNSIDLVYKTYKKPFVIAIDACLGKSDRVGHITIGYGPLKPGAGVNKDLPSVGNMHITGVVNLGGFMEYMILQNTRLNLVMKMADAIADGIQYSIWKLLRKDTKEQYELN
ncbi:spore protease YyaC [Crassaminicella profunda]|uniref:spore protease YyaC n=1 Tax=Crassaminicella profunda TaxID=1286698 RepID=UPI001CA68910|nr:spore protease YyaC [Crassaminicella profunda]QZY55076.1 spore protease YyaC [Crassaminicella profunda]